MKKSTKITTLAVAGVAAVGAIVGTIGTISYFTDTATPVDNTFTVGDVEIALYESQLHRQNSGRAATFTALSSDSNYCDYNTDPTTYFGNASLITTYDSARYCTPGMAQNTYSDDEDDISAIKNGHTAANRDWGFTDDVIKTDANTYETGYFAEAASNIVPGEWIRKFAYVENTGDNAAYVLIRYMVPTADAGNLTVKIPGTPYEEDTDATKSGTQAYFTAVSKNAAGQYVPYTLTNNGIDDYTGYTETIGDTEYKIYAAVTTEALNPDEMTFWSPVSTVKLNNALTEADVVPATQINIKVDAQAIQATTFDDAITAINNL